MVIKEADNKDYQLEDLNRLLTCKISLQQKFSIEKEINICKAGIRGETDSAYQIDFYFGHSNNQAVIHDLRLEHNGRIAQIDHIVINRLMEMYVLETKHFNYGIKITDIGEFLAWTGKTYMGIPSPLEQNERHLSVLKEAIDDNDVLPRRLGISIPFAYNSYVLVSPQSRIDRPKKGFDASRVIKADTLRTAIDKEIDGDWKIYKAAKIVSADTIMQVAEKLAYLHNPIKINYAAKFGVDVSQKVESPAPEVKKPKAKEDGCQDCGAALEGKVVFFCRLKKERFKGKLLCRDCQKAYT